MIRLARRAWYAIRLMLSYGAAGGWREAWIIAKDIVEDGGW